MGLILHRWSLILPRWSLILPRIPFPIRVLCSAVTHPFRGYVRTQNTPNPTPKHPFSWPEPESGQNELPSWQPGPQLGKKIELENGQTFLEVGIIHQNGRTTVVVGT